MIDKERHKPTYTEMLELYQQTPQSVWDLYFAERITWAKAILTEFSYL